MEVQFLNNINDCNPKQWDALFNVEYPFTKHAFLNALETSGCVSPSTGWQPKHITVTKNGVLIAATPCYLKTHSYGEYVFDWSWANAYQQHGLDYYPKLLSAIPFTPATGPRIGIDSSLKNQDDRIKLIRTIDQAIKNKFGLTGISSWHILFPTETLSSQLQQCQWQQRVGIQYHWFNNNFDSFDSFLQTFKSRKRKNVRKERESVVKQGFEMRIVKGEHINAQLMGEFYRFYHLTYLKRSGQHGYLNLAFFKALLQEMTDSLIMICAEENGTLIAAALCFKDDETLYGRYWGCEKEYDFLHFETCYYQGIEFCIANKLKRFDPGAQGEHKISRGFKPIKTYSNHVIFHPEFRQAINDFIDDEKRQIDVNLDYLNNLLPFKQENV